MSNTSTPMNILFTAVAQFNTALSSLGGAQENFSADPTIVSRYFAAPGARTDINATDVSNALSGIAAVFATLNSGGPPTILGEIIKMVP